MKFKTIDGHEINKELPYHKYRMRDAPQCKSKGQHELGQLLLKKFPHNDIFEEFPIKPYRNQTLYLDFFIPDHNLAFEYHGKQHYEHIPHFHGDIRGFHRQQDNDYLKSQWCEVNDIKLITMDD